MGSGLLLGLDCGVRTVAYPYEPSRNATYARTYTRAGAAAQVVRAARPGGRALAAGVCFAVPGLATGVAARPQKTGITMGPPVMPAVVTAGTAGAVTAGAVPHGVVIAAAGRFSPGR
ncbi:hypothetical protein [Streptomyces albidoflavus]|uniref:hypothetical protein n=1 Tax=Streptomyces albidoflavus TaxID=1886 RepID=UPI0033D47891